MKYKILVCKIKEPILNFINLKSAQNVFWNSFAGVWLALLILISTPWYVSKLGLELYGILSLWLVFQSLMNLFDFGLGATIIKEFASSKSYTEGEIYKRDLLKTIEIFYWSIAGAILILLIFLSNFISTQWLNLESPKSINLVYTLWLISATLFFQFPNVLYLNGLIGLQEHKLMNILQITGNTLRYGCGFLILFWHAELTWFFAVQIIVAASQTLVTRYILWKKISSKQKDKPVFKFTLIRNSARFSFGMALTSIAAVLLANVDRIAISKILPASELGRYAIAFTASGFLQLGIQPFYRSFFPRYSELYSLGDDLSLKNEYFSSSRMIAIIIISIGSISFFFAQDIFYVWMGNKDQTIINTFKLLIIAISCSGLGWLPAAFQQAQGWTSLHVKMLSGSILIGLPLMIFAINYYGVIGATTVWLIHGISEMTLGLWLMHRRLLKGELFTWYRTVLFPPILYSFPFVYLSFILKPEELNRFETFLWILVTGILLVTSSFVFLFLKRESVMRYLKMNK